MEEILTPSEVAALLRIHVKTVYNLVQQGAIPGNRIGHVWRFSKGAVLDLVSKKQKKPRAKSARVAAGKHLPSPSDQEKINP